jgi:hypothetical protein
MPRSSKWSLPFIFPNQNTVCISHLSHLCYLSHSSHTAWFYHPNNIWWSIQVMRLLVMQSSPTSHPFPTLGPNILLSTLVSNTVNLCSSPSMWDQISHPYKTMGKIMVFHILIFLFLERIQADRLWREW